MSRLNFHIRDKRSFISRKGTATWTGLQFQYHHAPKVPVYFMVMLVLFWTFIPTISWALKSQKLNEQNLYKDIFVKNTTDIFSQTFSPQQQGELRVVEGYYVDKKDNPMSEKTVEFERDGGVIGNDITDEEGYFQMDILQVGIDNPMPEEEKRADLEQNFPNPFRMNTTIEASIDEPGKMIIYDLQGKIHSAINLNEPGNYELSFGGMDLSSGIYLYSLITPNKKVTKKMIINGGEFGNSLTITGYSEHLDPEPVMKAGLLYEGDSIIFSGPNSTLIKYQFELQGDTLFTKIGNPGPDEFNPIPNTPGVVGDTLEWFIPDHVYNDEATNQYNSLSPNTWVSNDTLYFAVTQVGTTPVKLNVIDLSDGSLETLVEFNVSTNNTAPYLITNMPNQNSFEDSTLMIALNQYFGDNEGDALDYIFHNMPDATVDSIVNDTAYLMPDLNWNGIMFDIYVEASDGQYSVFSNDWDWTVNAVNDEPYEVSVILTQQCMAGDTAWIGVRPNHADDVDSPTLSYIANNLGGNATYVTQNDSVGIVPNNGFSGTIPGIVINVSDGQYNIDLTAFDLDVVLNNGSPVQTNTIPDQYSNEDTIHSINMQLYVMDPDNDPLFYTVAGLQNSQYTTSNDSIHFDPDFNWNGIEQDVEITVSDGIDQITMNLYDWYVAAVNDAPFITNPFSNYVMNEDSTLAIPLRPDRFDDVDSPSLTYVPNNLVNASHTVSNDTMYISPTGDWNGVIPGITITASDGQYPITSNSFSITVNPMPDLPQQILNIPTQNSDEDYTHVMDMLLYAYNPDGDQMTYVVNNQQNSTYSTNLDDVSLISNPQWYGTESGLEIVVTNSAGSINLNLFDHVVASINDASQVNPDSDVTDQDQSVETDVLANDTDNLDPGGALDPTAVSVTAQSPNGNAVPNPVTGKITFTPNPGWYGTAQYTYQAGDNGTPQLFDDAVVTVVVNQAPIGDVYIKVMDLMMDTLLPGATLTIGSNNYTLTNGDMSIAVAPGTYEVEATHPNTIDWTSIWEGYTAIQRPGQDANVEQRAKNDYSSLVTFDGTADTLYIYKVMNDFNMATVTGIIGSGPNGETARFSDNDLDAPAWANLNYTAPNTTTETRMQYWIAQLIPATKGKLNMVYQAGTTTPSVPYLEMAIDPIFNPSNGTSYNGNNEITSCFAHWPDNFQSKYVIGIEMIQAIGDLNDIGGSDPPILSYEGGDWIINDTGQECLHLEYNFDPGTKF